MAGIGPAVSRALRALYVHSPQRNLKRAIEKLGCGREADTAARDVRSVERNDVVEGILQAKTLPDILAHRLRRMGAKPLVLLGDKSAIDAWDLPAKCDGLSVESLDWGLGEGRETPSVPPEANVIVCHVPARPEEWLSVSALKESFGDRVFTLVELLLPYSRILDLQGKLDYLITDFDELACYYLGREFFGPLPELNDAFALEGKRVVEFGPFDACQTAGLVSLGVESVRCIEARNENAVKTLAAANAFGWDNVTVTMDDLHNVDAAKYGRYDLAFAHGVYYHSIAPFLFLGNLAGLSDNVFIGGYCATEGDAAGEFTTLTHEGVEYRVKVYEEPPGKFFAGVNPYGYYFHPDDLKRFFSDRGYSIHVITDEPEGTKTGRYLRFLAQKQA